MELPVTSNAVPMPDADQQDSLIVSVAGDGSLYFGADPISAAALTEKIKGGPSGPIGRELYIKADARTLYANVVKVLAALRTAGVDAPNLLTAQQGSPEPGTLVAPNGWKSPLVCHCPPDRSRSSCKRSTRGSNGHC